MKKNVLIFYCYVVIIGLQSCTKDIDVKLPNSEPKLVVSSFISPQDSLIQVAVSLSQPLYNNPNVSNKYNPLLNAIVTINNGTNSYNLTYDSNLERYIIDSFQLKITEGLTYYLSVNTFDGKYADANTKIPFANKTLIYTITNDPVQQNQYTLHGTWHDASSAIDYYEFDVRYTWYGLFSGTGSAYGSFTDTIKQWGGNKQEYINDTENQGGVFSRDLVFKYRTGKNDTVFAMLTTVSKEYTNYYEKLDHVSVSGSPFYEPVQMYTNISGGLGIFAGFNQYKLRVFP